MIVDTAGRLCQEAALDDAAGNARMPEWAERVAAGEGQGPPLLDWTEYEEVLGKCRRVIDEVNF